MVNNSTNINKTNNHLSSKLIEHKKKDHDIWSWKSVQTWISNLYIWPSIDASYHVSVHLAEGLQRRRLKCEKLTDDRRRTPSDGKSSHCLWQIMVSKFSNIMININKVIRNQSTFLSGGVTLCTQSIKYFCHLSVLWRFW
jgi:hypothetical protein